MTPEQKKLWLGTIRVLKDDLATIYPVIIRTTKRKKNHGLTWHRKKAFVIFINARHNFYTRLDTLIHEYAHCLDFHIVNDQLVPEHSESWGVWYARCYTSALKAMEKTPKFTDDQLDSLAAYIHSSLTPNQIRRLKKLL